MERDLIGYDEASDFTGIGKSTLYAMVCQKRLPHFRLGGRLVRFSKKELSEWLQERYIPENTDNVTKINS